MPRSYRHISDYEKEIIEMRMQGKTGREICETFGFTKKQYENFITRYNKKQSKIKSGEILRKKGRPPKKDKYDIETTKINELKYIIARKDSKIKSLEMENELMRDFLSLTERK